MTAINAERGFKKLVTIGEGFKDVLEAAEEINRIGGLSRAAKAMEASADDARQRQTIAEQKLKAVEEDVAKAEQKLADSEEGATKVRAEIARVGAEDIAKAKAERKQIIDQANEDAGKIEAEAQDRADAVADEGKELVEAHNAQIEGLKLTEINLGVQIRSAQAKLDEINREAANVVRKFSKD